VALDEQRGWFDVTPWGTWIWTAAHGERAREPAPEGGRAVRGERGRERIGRADHRGRHRHGPRARRGRQQHRPSALRPAADAQAGGHRDAARAARQAQRQRLAQLDAP
jgi:hypothetical protein